ncbi:VIR protein [Plasmodium vivax]|uniref:VIR protein n=1 Tax=Plasmodium vivax TaxID=5855 RepID=A0A1G4EGS5_PLAVI|nr:VIR protein [Plasmodium vivax]
MSLQSYYQYLSSFLSCKKDFDQIIIHKDRDILPKCNTFDSQISGNHVFVDPCQKIIKYLKLMQNGSYNENNKIDGCRYLNFYINNQVNSTYGNQSTEGHYKIFTQAFISNYSDLNICKDHLNLIPKEIIGNMKKIYNMYIKLDNVINATDIKKDNICSNIDECYQTYMSFKSYCTIDSHNSELCNALEDFRNYYLVNSQSVMRCTNDTKFPSFKVAQEEAHDADDADDSDNSDDSPNPSYSQHQPGQDDPARSLEISDSLVEDASGLNSSNSKTATAISTTLLLFPTLFTLYKFTPLGSLIRPYIQRNQKVQYNANDEMLQLYLPNYKAQDNINKEQLNVPYHS